MNPLSIYIHIPFCKSKCYYCDFLSFAGQEERMEAYVGALIAEIRSHGRNSKDKIVVSVFIGGGTPSILPEAYIEKIMGEVNENFEVDEKAEITIECNPGSLTREKVETYKKSGINRVSMGLQSANEEELRELGRIHSFEAFKRNFIMLKEMGIRNINVDLMFGLSKQTSEDWNRTLDQVIGLGPEHISAYGLLIEEGTPFFHKELDLPNEEDERAMYWQAHQKLVEKGYEHYEISNYGKKGFECQHNKVYWELGDYIGIGIGAASYFDGMRIENIINLEEYILAQGRFELVIGSRHTSSIQEKKEEFIFLGLRLMNGISKEKYKILFNETILNDYELVVKKMIEEGLLIDEGDLLRLSQYGIDISNYVFMQFLKN